MSALADLAEYLKDRIPLVEGRVLPLFGGQQEPRPTIIYQQDSSTPYYLMTGECDFTEMQVSYTAWSPDYAECEAITEQVRLALTGIVDLVGSTSIDCVLIESGEADGFEVQEGTGKAIYSQARSYFVRYSQIAATAPGV